MSKINQRHNLVTRLAQAPQDSFKDLFNAAPVALVEGVWGKSFKVLTSNLAVRNLFAAATPEQFNNEFDGILFKISHKILLELLSARVKGDQFEAEVRLPTFRKNYVYALMRMVHLPGSLSGPQHVLLAFQDISAIKQRENFLKKLSQVDGLTQVLNHRTILERLDGEMYRARRYQLDLSCVIFDIDDLKRINDTFGHLWGDKCIKQAAQVFKSCMRKTDIIGRYGGDEFVVIFPETKAEAAIIPVQRFMRAYKTHAEIKHKGKLLQTSFSIGIAGFPSKGIESVPDLIKAADQALYSSKTAGGNCYHLHAPKP